MPLDFWLYFAAKKDMKVFLHLYRRLYVLALARLSNSLYKNVGKCGSWVVFHYNGMNAFNFPVRSVPSMTGDSIGMGKHDRAEREKFESELRRVVNINEQNVIDAIMLRPEQLPEDGDEVQ